MIVMRQGKIVEQGPTERVLFAPEAQYTRDLLGRSRIRRPVGIHVLLKRR